MRDDPHLLESVRHFGVPLKEAEAAMVLLHGRGGSAEDILSLAQPLYHAGLAYLAPQAAGQTWYPNSFLAPIEENEPWLSSAIKKVGSTVGMALDAGIPTDKVFVCGFSQGGSNCSSAKGSPAVTESPGPIPIRTLNRGNLVAKKACQRRRRTH